MEAKRFRFEVGQEWRTRDGRTAVVLDTGGHVVGKPVLYKILPWEGRLSGVATSCSLGGKCVESRELGSDLVSLVRCRQVPRPGETWLTRDGLRAVVTSQLNQLGGSFCEATLQGQIEGNGPPFVVHWFADGSHLLTQEHGLDLVKQINGQCRLPHWHHQAPWAASPFGLTEPANCKCVPKLIMEVESEIKGIASTATVEQEGISSWNQLTPEEILSDLQGLYVELKLASDYYGSNLELLLAEQMQQYRDMMPNQQAERPTRMDADTDPAQLEPWTVVFVAPADAQGYRVSATVTVQARSKWEAEYEARRASLLWRDPSCDTVASVGPSRLFPKRPTAGPGSAGDLGIGDGLGPDGKRRK